MTITHPLLVAPLLIFVASITVTDISSHRIPNSFVLIAVVTALCLQTALQGWQGLAAAFGGFAVAFALFLPFYLVRAFSAGDVKAMGAVGSFLSPRAAFVAVLATLIAGSVLAIVYVLLRRGSLVSVFHRVVGVFAAPTHVAPPSGDHRAERFPYASAIALGAVIALVWARQASST